MTDMEIESEEDLQAERLAYIEMLSNPPKKVDAPVVVISDSEEETDVAPYGSDSDSDYTPKVIRKQKKTIFASRTNCDATTFKYVGRTNRKGVLRYPCLNHLTDFSRWR